MANHTPEPKPREDSVNLPGGEDRTVLSATAALVFYDDDQTPVDFVLYALGHFCGYDEPRARALIEKIGSKGRAVVATLQPLVAEHTRQRIAAAAQAAGYPFRVELELSDRDA